MHGFTKMDVNLAQILLVGELQLCSGNDFFFLFQIIFLSTYAAEVENNENSFRLNRLKCSAYLCNEKKMIICVSLPNLLKHLIPTYGFQSIISRYIRKLRHVSSSVPKLIGKVQIELESDVVGINRKPCKFVRVIFVTEN